ncbi:MAG: MBOAT family protein [Deltaproteobacteria bacterium]|nr:MBOAT family protein [Deltaproteobacteria bacterium]
MVFAAPFFVFAFLPVVLALHAVCPRSLRNALLLAASLLSYFWGEIDAFLLLIVMTTLNWLVAAWLPGRPRLLLAAIVVNLLPLVYFKYQAFLLAIIGIEGVQPTLPLGISFYTFQAISYLIDTSRSGWPRGRLVDVTLYTVFFPGMVAGPIERYADIRPQLQSRGAVHDFAAGIPLFVRGLAKKLLVANAVAVVADDFFVLPVDQMGCGAAWLAMVCYSLQIFFDFSGYSDMAVGLARMFGFRYPQNFNRPYNSRSVTEFWRRWHMTLSSWFRDYLYLPLGGNRRGAARTYLNLVIVFLLCGLWHGAAWTFVAWGAWHGAWLVIERAGLGRLLARLPAPLQNAYALVVVIVGWVLFRAHDLPQAGGVLRAMVGAGATPTVAGPAQWLSPHLVVVLGVALVATLLPERAANRVDAWLGKREPAMIALCLAGFALCALALAARTHNPFIYYRF